MKSNNDKVLEQIRRENYFDRHEITREGFGVWRCGTPDSSIGSFRVIAVPGTIAVVGDLGDMVLRIGHNKPLRWALGSKFKPDSTYYPMSKLSHFTENKVFCVESATAWLSERISEERNHGDRDQAKRYIKIARAWKHSIYHDHPARAEQDWFDIMSDHAYDEPPGFREHTTGTYFRYQALCWFMQHVTSKDSRFAEELKP